MLGYLLPNMKSEVLGAHAGVTTCLFSHIKSFSLADTPAIEAGV